MKMTNRMLITSLLIACCTSAYGKDDQKPDEQKTIITLNAFDNTDNGTGTIDEDDYVTITTKDKTYQGKAEFSIFSFFKPTKKNDPSVKYQLGTGNGTTKLISGTSSMNCEFNLDDVIAMGYCKDSSGKEFDLFAK